MRINLFERPHHEAQGLLRRGVPVFVTVNPVEYHGPHLSLHNDRLISLGLAADIHARLHAVRPDWPFVVAEDLEIGVGPTPGPGTRYLDFRQVDRLVRESCRALLSLGAKRVVFVTFHGDPLHNEAIDNGVTMIREAGGQALSPFNLLMHDMLRFDEVFDLDTQPFAEAFEHIENASARAAAKRGLVSDFHGGFFETSVAMHYAPHSVSPLYGQLPPCPNLPQHPGWGAVRALMNRIGQSRLARRFPVLAHGTILAREFAFASEAYGWHSLDPFPGYTGNPALSSAKTGEIFARYMVDRFSAACHAVLLDHAAPPQPIIKWAVPLSLSGRVGQLSEVTEAKTAPAPAWKRVAPSGKRVSERHR